MGGLPAGCEDACEACGEGLVGRGLRRRVDFDAVWMKTREARSEASAHRGGQSRPTRRMDAYVCMHETGRGRGEWGGGSDVLLGGRGDGPHADVLVVADVDHVRDAQAARERDIDA